MLKSMLSIVCVGFAFADFCHGAIDYDSWFKMAASDAPRGWRESSYILENWTDPSTQKLTIPSSGRNYYVPAGYVLHSQDTATRFVGDSLALAGTFECTISGGQTEPFTELRMLAGSKYYHSSKNYMNADRLVIEGTAENPAEDDMYELSGSQYTQYAGSWFGESEAVFRFSLRTLTGRSYDGVFDQQRYLSANLSQYYGRTIAGRETCLMLAGGKAAVYAGALEVETNAVLTMAYVDAALTVGEIRLNPGSELNVYVNGGNGGFSTYTVTDKLVVGGNFRVAFRYDRSVENLFKLDDSHYQRGWTLIHINKEAVAASSVDLTHAEIVNFKAFGGPDFAKLFCLKLFDNADGSQDLTVAFDYDKAMIRNNASNGSGTPLALETDNEGSTCWEDGEVPAPDFEGDVLTLHGRAWGFKAWANCSYPTMRVFAPASDFYFQCASLTLDELHMVGGSSFNTYNNARYPELHGKFITYPGTDYIKFMANDAGGEDYNRTYRIHAEMSGTGNIKLGTADATKVVDMELFGTNTNFAGAIYVCALPGQYRTEGKDMCPTLYLNDGRNLGGPYAGVSAWKSLMVDGHAVVAVRDDVTLDEPTRGVFVSGAARFVVPEAKVFEIAEPLTFGGELTKLGAGMLRLSGAARFSLGGAEPTETPSSNNNVLRVEEGFLSVGATNALDGVSVFFADGTALSVDIAESDGDVRRFGAVSLKSGSSIVAEGANLSVRLMGAVPETDGCEVAICTVSPTVAAKLNLSVPTRYSRRAVTFSSRPNADGSMTLLASVAPKGGLAVIVR